MKTHRKHFLLSLFSMATILSVILAACGYVKVFNGSGGKKLKWNAETGYQVEAETDKLAECVASLDTTKLTFATGDISTAVTGDITLPATILDCSVSWSVDSSVSGWISISGSSATVTRVDSETNGSITLVGAVSYGSSSQNKDLSITILRKNVTDEEKVAACVAALDVSKLTFSAGDTSTTVTGNITLPSTISQCSIAWSFNSGAASWISISGTTATVTRVQSATNATVTLTGALTAGSASQNKNLSITILRQVTDSEAVAACVAAFPASPFTFATGDSISNIYSAFTALTAQNDCSVTWSLSAGLTWLGVSGGTFTRTSIASGSDQTGTITATISRISASDSSKTFSVTVKGGLADVNALAAALSSSSFAFTAPDTASSVTQNFTLPIADGAPNPSCAPYTCNIVWTEVSDTLNAVSYSSGTATVTRPSYAAGNATVTLKATVTRSDGLSYSATSSNISVTVKRQAPTTAEAVSQCKSDLTIGDFTGSGDVTNVNASGTSGTIANTSATGTFSVPTSDTIGDTGATTACTISWASSSTPHVSFSSGTGTFNNFHDGDVSSGTGKTITVTATISSGVTTDTKAFTLDMTKRGTLSGPANKNLTAGIDPTVISVFGVNSSINTSATRSYMVCLGPDGDSALNSISGMSSAAAARSMVNNTTNAVESTCSDADPRRLNTLATYCCTTSAINVPMYFVVPGSDGTSWRARIYAYVLGDADSDEHKIFYNISGAVNPSN
jgi:hypothetical protein